MEDALLLKRKELGSKTSHSSCQNLTMFFFLLKTVLIKKPPRHLYMHVLILVAIKVIPLLLGYRDLAPPVPSPLLC